MSSGPASLGETFRATVRRRPGRAAVRFRAGRKYVSYTWAEVQAKVDAVATFLLEAGVEGGDRVAILSENRPEWLVTDLAALSIGAVTVPIYTSLTSAEIEYQLNDSGAKVLAVSGKNLFDKIPPVLGSLTRLRRIVGFDASLALDKDAYPIPLSVMRDIERVSPAAATLSSRLSAVRPDDPASFIYTSGTTGFPKAVVLTHANFLDNLARCRRALKMNESDVHLSFLPLSHVFERTAGHYLMIQIGATIAYAGSLDTVPRDMLDIRPTFLLGVPRFYEKIRARVEEAVAASPASRKALFVWAREIGAMKRRAAAAGRPGTGPASWKLALAHWLVYRKFRSRLGGRIRFCVSGGAALPASIAEYFYDLGVLILEGYGLTETSPVISVNREERWRFGTVGIPLEGVEVRIEPDGEIVTKSPSVMAGYHGKPAETAAVLADGWFRTGDLGQIDRDGFLSITGRKKELIVTSGGKKVSPRPVEESLEKDPLILRCVLHGEGRRYLTALVVPRREALEAYAKAQKIACGSYAELLEDPRIYRLVEAAIEERSKELASYERIKYFLLLERDFLQSEGELTPTLKVKRQTVYAIYRDKLEALYRKDAPAP